MVWPFSSSSSSNSGSDKSQPQAPKPSPAEDQPKTFDPAKLPDREKLPPKLQKLVDKADKDGNFYDELAEG